jgi:4-hydroxy 2-oxovalerate aldolase
MKLIDVTLRDGGHNTNWNWPISFVKDYYKTLSSIPVIKYIEMGYWKQNGKSKAPFYNLTLKLINKITGKLNLKNISVMVDYHFCSKDLNDYPTKKQKKIAMIRIAARKKDLSNAIDFSEKLQKKTGLIISLNIIKITNFSFIELIKICKKINNSKLKYVCFADTHGNLNLAKDKNKYRKVLKVLQNKKKHTGLHLHDNSGYAVMNHTYLKSLNVKMSDTSIKGMGKGYGNLKLEHVIDLKNLPKITNLIKKYEKLWTQDNDPYSIITGAYSLSDGYASLGRKRNYPIFKFSKICSQIRGNDKDTVNYKLL